MRIAQLSKADSSGGGASRVAEELNSLLNEVGHSSTHFMAYSSRSWNNTSLPLYGKYGFIQRAIRFIHRTSRRLGVAEIVPLELLALQKTGISAYELLHFHDLSSAISPWTLKWLARKNPVIWTIHDCSPFTGGCLYPMDCLRFKSECGSCPQIGTWPLDAMFDGTRIMRSIKYRLHQENRVRCITPSKWMAKIAMSSGMFLNEPKVVTNGVNTDIYQPLSNKSIIRNRLGLPDDRPILLVSAGHIRDPRKGIHIALKAVRQINYEFQPFVLAMGIIKKKDEYLFNGLRWLSTGFVSDPKLASLYYACADFFIFCSLSDNQPLAILESLACGTPVIGFGSGGVPEIVIDDVCGKLVPTNDLSALIEVMRLALSGKISGHWAHESRKHIEQFHSHRVHLETHLRLYESFIEEWRAIHA